MYARRRLIAFLLLLTVFVTGGVELADAARHFYRIVDKEAPAPPPPQAIPNYFVQPSPLLAKSSCCVAKPVSTCGCHCPACANGCPSGADCRCGKGQPASNGFAFILMRPGCHPGASGAAFEYPASASYQFLPAESRDVVLHLDDASPWRLAYAAIAADWRKAPLIPPPKQILPA